ncbi:HI0074 family nucleotidyltransferase substrate-binding subunit [Thioalkalivibrio sp. ALJ24]|uniref:HI0074 family nucleotidyltransferase substrate-binding subunit n=1 Tax=Thioalkalivibrio sp. ALJ24 TaxID=545276 RepID=UPI0003823F80|nr:HI0074 family nucleotidyltransferase substrate-binding subunit [Thioalkalivibrio sp. ALJ24]
MNKPLESFGKALDRLDQALAAPASDLARDASIQRFEFTFDLAWKSVKAAAAEEGLECASPRSCLRLALGQGWITEETVWLAMLDDRNRAAHTYDEKLAAQLYSRLPDYLPAFHQLKEALGT